MMDVYTRRTSGGFNQYDEEVESDPDYPILDELLDRIEGIDTDGFVTAADVPGIIDGYLGGIPNSKDSIGLTAPFKMKVKQDSPLDVRTVVDTESDIMNIEYPYVGMIIYVRDTGKRYEVLTLADREIGLASIKNTVVGTYRELDYATTEYVDKAVSNAGGDINLDGYCSLPLVWNIVLNIISESIDIFSL